MPMMDKMIATWDLKEDGDGQTRAQVTMHFNTKPAFMSGLMTGMMKKMMKGMLIGLKYYMETGNLVTKDNIKGITKNYKRLKGNEAFSGNIEAIAA